MSGQGYQNIHKEIINLLKEGKKIEAVKFLREETGLGLKEAKEEVEKIFAGDKTTLQSKKVVNISASEDVLTQLRLGRKIDAIKVLRQNTGLGLKDAKDEVEKILSEDPEVQKLYSAHSREGIRKLFFIILFIIISIILFFLFV